MKLLLGAMLLALIAGSNCQYEPSAEQIECYQLYATSNPTDQDVIDAGANCPNATAKMDNPDLVCQTPSCLTPLARVFYRCSYDLAFSEYTS